VFDSSHRILSKSGELQELVFAFNSHENCLAMRLLLGVTEDQLEWPDYLARNSHNKIYSYVPGTLNMCQYSVA